MRSLISRYFTSDSGTGCHLYDSNAILFKALEAREDAAIRCIQTKVGGYVLKNSMFSALEETEKPELINDATMLLLQKIQSGEYIFQGHDPATFAIETARRMLPNLLRKQKKNGHTDLDSLHHLPDVDILAYYDQKEREEEMAKNLSKLSENCERLIRLKYFDGWKDEEIIQQKLTQYTTVGTLKVKRSECMKKLASIVGSKSK